MLIKLHHLIETGLILALSIFWCEVGYYYFVFHFNCSGWLGSTETGATEKHDGSQLTKLMVIADVHIMGPIKSIKIDKLRREWQMQQAFRISNSIFEPDVIVFMGDLLDEGSFSRDELFEQACDDFERIFSIDRKKQEIVIIPGNHDVGFHDQMANFPYLLTRFSDRFKSTSTIEIMRTLKTKHLNLIVSNSMSFYNDTCPYCSLSMALIQQMERYLQKQREQTHKEYTAPILLGHIPLYRKNNLDCIFPSQLRSKVAKANLEGEDVIHSAASEQILARLRPRLAVSGHTHMFCKTKHLDPTESSQDGFNEITISSYNHKYAEYKPGFLLMSANATHTYTTYCNLIDEWAVVAIYSTALLAVIFRLIFMRRVNLDEEILLDPTRDEQFT